jgi:signal recognition particle receptor subunit alpha
MGYSRDPSSVAAAAKAYARENHFDCVLIDTAGRMQNNEPLMKALAKLVTDNSPNLVLFVGEALVGNDGIDQLTMFDQALKMNCPIGTNQGITGIVLTKVTITSEIILLIFDSLIQSMTKLVLR